MCKIYTNEIKIIYGGIRDQTIPMLLNLEFEIAMHNHSQTADPSYQHMQTISTNNTRSNDAGEAYTNALSMNSSNNTTSTSSAN